ncbi:MAG: beta-lactamase family protein, partial [Myxococcales bacterium]|nr:beta-lactamase family protein [Myxococcales bacterium]
MVYWQEPTGPAVPALAAFDAGMQAYITQLGITGGALALVRDGRLVLARGYSNDEFGRWPMEPTTRFRIASTTKVLTCLLIHQLYDAGKLAPGDKVQDLLKLRGPKGEALVDDPKPANLESDGRYFGAVTVDNLVRHLGGWDRNTAAREPTHVYDGEIAEAFGHPLPVSVGEVASWGATQTMQFYPGSRYSYSNFGYMLLGLVIEAVTGKRYFDVLRESLLRPLGVLDARPTRPLLEQRSPDEALYSVFPPSNLASAVHDDKHLVPVQYGGENHEYFTSFGGLVMSPAEYVRVLAAIGKNEAPIPKSPLSMGVWGKTKRNGVVVYEHAGDLPGCWSYATLRQEGGHTTGLFVVFNSSLLDT